MRHRSIQYLAVAFFGLALYAAGQQAPPAMPESPKLLPSKYNALIYRDIFTKEFRYGPGSPFNPTFGSTPTIFHPPPSTQQASTTQPIDTSASPESALSLRGVVDWGGQYAAFVEDASSGKTMYLKPGDAISRGKITAVTLHGLDYQANGARVQHVNESENFLGQLTLPVLDVPMSASSPASPPPGAPSGFGGPSPTPSSSSNAVPPPPPLPPGDSIEDRMRRRRQSESGR